MKSVEIPCSVSERGDRLAVGRGSSTLVIRSYEGAKECNIVCLDREGVEKLIAAAQEWLQNSPE